MLCADQIELLYQDFQKIREMQSDDKIKHRMISGLFSQNPFCWRVKGITLGALHEFCNNEWKKDGIKINRSHVFNRIETHLDMLNNEMDKDKWWNFYWSRDYTILSLSSENKKISDLDFISIDTDLGLFRTSGFAWRHGKAEKEYLKSLWDKHGLKSDMGVQL